MSQPSGSEEPMFRSDTPDGIVMKQEGNETIIKLAHDGNIVLIVSAATTCTASPPTTSSADNQKKFLVSSAILGQASRLFRQWFAGIGGNLKKCADGTDHLRLQAAISLRAIEIILLKLHYHDAAPHDPQTPQELEAVMREASKLACTRALSPWIRDWISEIPTAANLTEQKAFIMAAHFSEDQKLIDAMVARAAWGATKKEWETFEKKSKEKMPPSLLRSIFNHIERYSNQLAFVIQEAESVLQQGGNWKTCGGDSRVVLYFNALRKSNIWPTASCFQEQDLVGISNGLKMIADKWQHHQCDGRRQCPLRGQIKQVSDKVSEYMLEAQNLWPRMPAMKSLENA